MVGTVDGGKGPALPAPAGTRERLLALVAAHPGLNKREACLRLGIAWGTLSYHVQRLCAAGRLHAEPRGREVLLFPAGTAPAARCLAAAAREADCQRLLEALASVRQTNLQELSVRLGLPRKAVRRLLLILIEAGLVANTSRGRPRYVLVRSASQPPQAGAGPSGASVAHAGVARGLIGPLQALSSAAGPHPA